MGFKKINSLIATVVASALAISLAPINATPAHAVRGGVGVQISEYPYYLEILRFKFSKDTKKLKSYHACGAALISPRYAVTAAHCFIGEDKATGQETRLGEARTRYGAQNTKGEGGKEYATRVRLHPGAESDTKVPTDIAVLQLEQPIPNTRRFAKLPIGKDPSWYVNQPGIFVGMGHRGSKCLTPGDVLRTLKDPLPTVTGKQYSDEAVHPRIDHLQGRSTCPGDSGGGLLVDGFLIGVDSKGTGASTGDGNAHTNFSSVQNALPWLLGPTVPKPTWSPDGTRITVKHPRVAVEGDRVNFTGMKFDDLGIKPDSVYVQKRLANSPAGTQWLPVVSAKFANNPLSIALDWDRQSDYRIGYGAASFVEEPGEGVVADRIQWSPLLGPPLSVTYAKGDAPGGRKAMMEFTGNGQGTVRCLNSGNGSTTKSIQKTVFTCTWPQGVASAGRVMQVSGNFTGAWKVRSTDDSAQPLSVNSFGSMRLSSFKGAFAGVTTNPTMPKNIPSTVRTLSQMFDHAVKFNQDISEWDTSQVTKMNSMFAGATAFNQDISKWKTGNVSNMSYMFDGASTFNQPIGDWDVSNVESLIGMFRGAGSFRSDISRWDVVGSLGRSKTDRPENFAGAVTNKWEPRWKPRKVEYTPASLDEDTPGQYVTVDAENLKGLKSITVGGDPATNITRRGVADPGSATAVYGFTAPKKPAGIYTVDIVREREVLQGGVVVKKEEVFPLGTLTYGKSKKLIISRSTARIVTQDQITLYAQSRNKVLAPSQSLRSLQPCRIRLNLLGRQVAVGPAEGCYLVLEIQGSGLDSITGISVEGEEATLLDDQRADDKILFDVPLLGDRVDDLYDMTVSTSVGDGEEETHLYPDFVAYPPLVSETDPTGDESEIVTPGDANALSVTYEITHDRPYAAMYFGAGADGLRVDCGDGDVREKGWTPVPGLVACDYDGTGDRTMTVSGSAPGDWMAAPLAGSAEPVAVHSFGNLGITSLRGAFASIATNPTMPAVLPDTVTDLSHMFQNASTFNRDISSWDTAKVGNMERMFSGASAFGQNLSGWNVSGMSEPAPAFGRGSAMTPTDYPDWADAGVDTHDTKSGSVITVSLNERDGFQCLTETGSVVARWVKAGLIGKYETAMGGLKSATTAEEALMLADGALLAGEGFAGTAAISGAMATVEVPAALAGAYALYVHCWDPETEQSIKDGVAWLGNHAHIAWVNASSDGGRDTYDRRILPDDYSETGTADGGSAGNDVVEDVVEDAVEEFSPRNVTVSSSAGPTAGGGKVRLSGEYMDQVTAVRFGDRDAQIVSQSAREVTVTVPAHAAGTVPVTITYGTANQSRSVGEYVYGVRVEDPSVAMMRGPLAGGNDLVVFGDELDQVTDVTMDGVPVDFRLLGGLHVTVPAAQQAGVVTLELFTGSTLVWSGDYTYVSALTATGLDVTSGSTLGGNTIAVNGAGLTGATVHIGGQSAKRVSSSDTWVRVKVPQSVSLWEGSVADVTVTYLGETVTLPGAYTYVPVTEITETYNTVLCETSQNAGGRLFKRWKCNANDIKATVSGWVKAKYGDDVEITFTSLDTGSTSVLKGRERHGAATVTVTPSVS